MASKVNVVPQALTDAAHEIVVIENELAAAGQAAAPQLRSIELAAEDEVSVVVREVFQEYARDRQIEMARLRVTMGRVADQLRAAEDAYAATEAFALAELRIGERDAEGLIRGATAAKR